MYPYNDPYWNLNDQKYLCKMNGWGYPISRIREPFKYIIEQKKCSTFEAEYAQWLEDQQAQQAPADEPNTGTV
jgi:hypothetical protein